MSEKAVETVGHYSFSIFHYSYSNIYQCSMMFNIIPSLILITYIESLGSPQIMPCMSHSVNYMYIFDMKYFNFVINFCLYCDSLTPMLVNCEKIWLLCLLGSIFSSVVL